MGDPFEEPPAGTASPAMGSPPVREASVQQAVTFLNDPRVKSADVGKALSFLRGKGITEEELREAHRRCGLPFPSIPPGPHPPPPFAYGPPVPFPPPPGALAPYHPYPPPRRTSWVSVFLGITAAAGIYTALREVLKRYVVPMYFPDAARVAEERRRRDEMTLQAQERQIAELRETVHELVETSRKTNQNVEQLSASLSTSMALQERELSQNSELRDAIRDLSRSVTASGGTDISIPTNGDGSGTVSGTVYPPFLNGSHGQKHGSLAYGHAENFNASLLPHAQESTSRPVLTPLTGFNGKADGYTSAKKSMNKFAQRSVVSVQGSTNADVGTKENGDDDFMSITPAVVEESWGARMAQKQGDGVDSDSKKNDEQKEKNDEDVNGSKEVASKVVDSEHTNGNTTTTEEPSDEIERVAESGGLVPHGVDRGLADTTSAWEASTTNTARQLFHSDLLNEANMVLGKSPSGRARPLSMPQMDLPLSDGED